VPAEGTLGRRHPADMRERSQVRILVGPPTFEGDCAPMGRLVRAIPFPKRVISPAPSRWGDGGCPRHHRARSSRFSHA